MKTLTPVSKNAKNEDRAAAYRADIRALLAQIALAADATTNPADLFEMRRQLAEIHGLAN